MAQQARQAMTIAPRAIKPAIFGGTDASWRTLCDLYPAAETTEIIMAVVEYCAVRKLDPFKKPVHIVPMYNAKLRRKVQVVMQGINEVEITAARTGAWAGMDAPAWGPEVERTFRGTVEENDGSTRKIELAVTYREWCAVTVYRIVAGERRAFTEQLFFDECYGRASFRSEVPNDRWAKAPRQMLHKCTKAAVLRAAFPEEGISYTAEEMEDREIDTGGVTIEGKIDHGDPGLTERDRRAEAYQPRSATAAPGKPRTGLALLEEENGTQWLRNLSSLLMAATTEEDVGEIAAHERVRVSLANAPTLIRDQITKMLSSAHERVRATVEEEQAPPPGHGDDQSGAPGEADAPGDDEAHGDLFDELLAEVEVMDGVSLDGIAENKPWRARARTLFPPDMDRLRAAIAARKAALKGARTNDEA